MTLDCTLYSPFPTPHRHKQDESRKARVVCYCSRQVLLPQQMNEGLRERTLDGIAKRKQISNE